MVRPAAALPARLLREAAEILARDGVAALTVRRVAEAAGCSTIGIYTHFGDKHGLLEALLVDAHADFHAAVAVVDDLAPGRAQLAAGAHAYRDWALANRSRYLVMFASHVPDFRPSEEARHRMSASLRAHTQRVADAIAVGDVIPGDPEEVAVHLWASVHGHVMVELFYLHDAPDDRARQAFDRHVMRLLDGVAPAAGPRVSG